MCINYGRARLGYVGGVQYVERLWVPAWWWLVVALLVTSAAAATFAYAPVSVGIAVTLLFLACLGGLLIGYGRLRVAVDETALSVGRHRIEGRWIRGAEAFGGEAAARVLGPGANRADFLVTRPYAPGVVRITLADPADPHPGWVVSSRRPAELAQAVSRIAGRA